MIYFEDGWYITVWSIYILTDKRCCIFVRDFFRLLCIYIVYIYICLLSLKLSSSRPLSVARETLKPRWCTWSNSVWSSFDSVSVQCWCACFASPDTARYKTIPQCLFLGRCARSIPILHESQGVARVMSCRLTMSYHVLPSYLVSSHRSISYQTEG